MDALCSKARFYQILSNKEIDNILDEQRYYLEELLGIPSRKVDVFVDHFKSRLRLKRKTSGLKDRLETLLCK